METSPTIPPRYPKRFARLVSLCKNSDYNANILIEVQNGILRNAANELRTYIRILASVDTSYIPLYSDRSIKLHDKHILWQSRLALQPYDTKVILDYESGFCSDFFHPNDPPPVSFTSSPFRDIPPKTENFCTKYTPETFHAFCHLKNLGLIKSAVVLQNISYHELPQHSQYSNLLIFADTEDSIAIL